MPAGQWNGCASGYPKCRFPQTRKRRTGTLPAEYVREETERLETKLKQYDEQADIRARYAAHALAFDLSPKGELMRRYETKCQRYVDKFLTESRQRRINNSANRYTPADHDYVKPRTRAFPKAEGPIDSPEKAELDRVMESIRNRVRARTAEGREAKVIVTAVTEVEPSVRTLPPVRNEPNAAVEANATHVESEQVVTPERAVASGSGTGRVLRNEAKLAVASPPRGNKQPKAWDNSRRARRAREAMDRADGSRDLGEALNLAGPGARNLLVPVGTGR